VEHEQEVFPALTDEKQEFILI